MSVGMLVQHGAGAFNYRFRLLTNADAPVLDAVTKARLAPGNQAMISVPNNPDDGSGSPGFAWKGTGTGAEPGDAEVIDFENTGGTNVTFRKLQIMIGDPDGAIIPDEESVPQYMLIRTYTYGADVTLEPGQIRRIRMLYFPITEV